MNEGSHVSCLLNEVMLGLIWVLSEEAIICFHLVMFANQHKAILASLTYRTELIKKVEFYFTHKIIVYLFLLLMARVVFVLLMPSIVVSAA